MGEFELIAKLFAPLATERGALGLKDDAAFLKFTSNKETVVTMDVLVEGVHFPSDTPPGWVAQKALGVNLSDLAAIGADPFGYILGLQIPEGRSVEWLTDFSKGLQLWQEVHSISLLGGDTVVTPGPLTISITAIGSVNDGKALLRSGAQTGDQVFVSGTIGDAFLGLGVVRGEHEVLTDDDRIFLKERFHLPKPRLRLGSLLKNYGSSAIDVSDGLVADAGHIAATSGVRLEIDADKVPLSDAAQAAITAGIASIGELITGGDDYELLFTMAQRRSLPLTSQDVQVTEIGCVVEGAGVGVTLGGKELPLFKKGYTHL